MLNKSFYTKNDLIYPEIGILLEDSIWINIKEKAKIYIPILMPEVSNNGDILIERISIGGTIVVNSNYISLYIPDYLYKIDQDTKYLKKGTKVILSFIGGGIDDIYVTNIAE